MMLLFAGITLPLEDPILKFLLILVIILAAPLLLNKLKIPYLLGLIIAGAVIGPHGLNLVLRDSSIILSGTAGLLYIMFLSGLDMDMSDFRKNGTRSLVFGLYTFCVPLLLGILAGYYILGFSIYSSILLAGLFASQTLIAYPIVSKLGIARDKAVTIAVGGTVITDTLALLLLTVIVGMVTGNTDDMFWYRLGISVVLCIAFIMLLFPLIGHWFFKHCSDNISQYIFVLVMVFLGAYLAHLAGLEPIIGAFLAGLALNRLIPRTSPLMNRIEFVGNAIFIPFFLIGVGMLIDYRAFFRDWESIKVAAVMIVLITAAKYIAALLTQKTFKLSSDQRTVIFGLSSAHVAATLAAVMVGYNVIVGQTPDGEPIRLLGESVLNGTILMILATCTISTFATQRGAHNIAIKGVRENDEHQDEHILIPVSNEESVRELVTLGNVLKSKKNHNGFYALHAIDNKVEDSGLEKRARKILETAATAAAASDIYLHELLRYDVNISNAIASVVKEQSITDIVMGLHRDKSPAIFLGKITGDLLGESNVTTYIYKPVQPLATIKRHIVIIPSQAEKEAGFLMWLHKIGNLARNTGTKIVVYAPETTLKYIEPLRRKQTATVETVLFKDWEKLPALLRELRTDDCLWLVMSRRERISYQPAMNKIPAYLDQYLGRNSFVLIYPVQAGDPESRYL
ncbi:cation:proton antiporter [Alistipes putredinis]|jgi:Kef-type K+ transport system membrane component KefB|uniref:cation:proton antiporter n=1 Tax=Alistipes putredinis TaxID=28117 RepID=UPI00396786E9